jgi:replicative DNA helicase
MNKQLSDIGAERAILASLIQGGTDAYLQVCDLINYETFSNSNNQILYRCIEKVIQNNQSVDVPVNISNVISFAAQIKKFEFARNIKKLTQKIAKDIDSVTGSEPIDEIISILENPVTDFLREDTSGKLPEKIGQNIEEYLSFLGENKCDIVGIPTGFSRYDEAIGGGLRRKCVDLISARPKVGKTVFADNVAINVCTKGIPVLMLDTEMGKEDHLNRILSNLSGVPINEIATGKFVDDQEKYEKVVLASQKLAKLPYSYVSVAGKPFEQILNIIKRWIVQEVKTDETGKTKDCLIIYDYLKLMSSDSINNNIQEYQALGFQITSLHNLCVKLDIPCLSFVQLNRDGITRESTDTVSGSDRLIWLCTSFSIFKLKSPEELAEDGPNAGNRKLVPIVSRHGSGLDDGNYINMSMQGAHAKIVELKTRNEFKSQPVGDTGMVDSGDMQRIKDGIESDQE